MVSELNQLGKKVLIVDDEKSIRDSLSLLLKNNFSVFTAEDGQQALAVAADCQPDLILLDVTMPNLDGLETLRALKQSSPATPVIMLTAINTVRTAVAAMKAGALDYVSKPFDIDQLTSLIVSTFNQEGGEKRLENSSLPTESPPADFGRMVGTSATMQALYSKISTVAERDVVVLITGESGTGKELVAREIHDRSLRAKKPFVAVNCAAIPESLIESELFGHEKGAFTSAVEKRIGLFEQADQGTLFLDEIGELSLGVQVKLLRFLQEREFFRVGSSKKCCVDVRIICATNKILEEQVAAKLFREDLFYRINVVNLSLTPLRDRFEDIPRLVEYFVSSAARRYSDKVLTFSPAALSALTEYSWPGNVRELQNVIESLMALLPGGEVQVDDLPRKILAKTVGNALKIGGHGVDGPLSFTDAEKLFESEMIVKALRKTNYVQTRAAELLGISRRILKYKMDKLGISEKAEQ